jgi:hypothetical protein
MGPLPVTACSSDQTLEVVGLTLAICYALLTTLCSCCGTRPGGECAAGLQGEKAQPPPLCSMLMSGGLHVLIDAVEAA